MKNFFYGEIRFDNFYRERAFLLRFSFYIAILMVCLQFNLFYDFLVYWIIPYVFILVPILRIRGLTEHWAVENTHILNSSRNIYLSILSKLLLFPRNVHYHLDHHLYPQVPFYNLPKLHKMLQLNNTYRLNAHVNKGLWHVCSDFFTCFKGNKVK